MSKTLKSILTVALIGFGSAFLGFFLVRLIGKANILQVLAPIEPHHKPWVIFGGIAMIFLVLAIHELGHLITGLVQGFQFQLFVVGFLGIARKESGGIKVYFNKDLNLFGGVALTVPTQDDPQNAKKFARILIAGPIASLLLAFFCFVLGMMSQQPTQVLAYLGALGSLGIFLATTLPAKTGVFYTDRKRYQRLTGVGIEREIELALIKVLGMQMSGESYSELPLGDIQTIKQDPSLIIKYSGTFYEYAYYLKDDPSRLEEIKKELQALESKLPNSFVQVYRKEMEKLEHAEI